MHEWLSQKWILNYKSQRMQLSIQRIMTNGVKVIIIAINVLRTFGSTYCTQGLICHITHITQNTLISDVF